MTTRTDLDGKPYSTEGNLKEAQDSESDFQRLVMLPPYVAEEHRKLLDDAENAVEEYSEMLLGIITKELYRHGVNIKPLPCEIREAEKAYLNDPVRQLMIKKLCEIKTLVERPRFMVPATQYLR